MFLDEWGRWLRRLADRLNGKSRLRPFRRARLNLETLEERATPSTSQVDSGGANDELHTSQNLSYHNGALIPNVTIEPIFLKDSLSHQSSPNPSSMDGFFTTITSHRFIPSL